jgi:hypothetical protein
MKKIVTAFAVAAMLATAAVATSGTAEARWGGGWHGGWGGGWRGGGWGGGGWGGGWGCCGWGGWWGPAFATGVAAGAVASYPYWGGDYGYGYGNGYGYGSGNGNGCWAYHATYSRSGRYLGRRWVNLCQ